MVDAHRLRRSLLWRNALIAAIPFDGVSQGSSQAWRASEPSASSTRDVGGQGDGDGTGCNDDTASRYRKHSKKELTRRTRIRIIPRLLPGARSQL